MSSVLEVTAFAADGTARARAVKLPTDPFDGRVHEPAMHQAVKVYLANQRQGTAATKTRGFVSGGNQKPWRQKGTGRARQGSTRSPLWPGGGTMFGPHPREYRLGMPTKLRRLARSSALNARARERALTVIEPLTFAEPKTKLLAALLGKMGLDGHRVLLLTSELKRNVLLSARNIPDVAVMRYQDASTYDILKADVVVVEEAALGGALETGGEVTHAPAPKPKKAKRVVEAAEAEAEAETPARRKTAKPAAKKAAAKRPAAKKAAKPARAAKKPAKKPGRKKD